MDQMRSVVVRIANGVISSYPDEGRIADVIVFSKRMHRASSVATRMRCTLPDIHRASHLVVVEQGANVGTNPGTDKVALQICESRHVPRRIVHVVRERR